MSAIGKPRNQRPDGLAAEPAARIDSPRKTRGRPRKPRPPGLRAELGARLVALRAERHWTAAELADAAGLGMGTILRLESGSASPTLDTIQAIAAAFVLTPHELLRACPTWAGKPR